LRYWPSATTRLEDAGRFEPEDIVALGGEIAGVDEADVGRLAERPRAIAGELVGRRLARGSRDGRAVVGLELAVLEVGAEVQLVAAHQRRVDRPGGADPAVVVEAAVDRVGGEQPGIDPHVAGLVDQARRETDPASVGERIVERGALEERDEPRARNLLEAVPGLMVADNQVPRLVLGRVGEDHVAEAGRGVGEVHLELVAEAAGDGALGAQPDAAGAGVEPEVAGDDVVVGVADVADVVLDAAARLERPAGFLVLVQGRALPRRGHRGHLRLDALERFLERLDLRLEQLDLGLGIVGRNGGGDRGIGRRVGRVRLGRLFLSDWQLLREGGC